MKFQIETERLFLRELKLSDLDSMFELDSNPLVHKYLGNKPVKTKDESLKIIQSIIKQYQERGMGRWATIEKASGLFIGWSGLRLNTEYKLNRFTSFIDVGYRLLPEFWGKGYATESGKAAINYAFTHLTLPQVSGVTEMNNQASHRALLKIGLKYIDLLKLKNI